ncbi:MAG: hypothetical protein HY905_03890 [Deltaproteobacteria bacterium]|nr:hypothetical protein [Deltaproteobacteria bacterium]
MRILTVLVALLLAAAAGSCKKVSAAWEWTRGGAVEVGRRAGAGGDYVYKMSADGVGSVGTLASDVGSAVWDATNSGISWVGARAEDGGVWVYDVASDAFDAAQAWVEEDPCRAIKVATGTAVGAAFLYIVLQHGLPALAARGVSGSAALSQALAKLGQLKGAGGVAAGVGMVAGSYHVFRELLDPVLNEVCHAVR